MDPLDVNFEIPHHSCTDTHSAPSKAAGCFVDTAARVVTVAMGGLADVVAIDCDVLTSPWQSGERRRIVNALIMGCAASRINNSTNW
jgi:hypothetical protein